MPKATLQKTVPENGTKNPRFQPGRALGLALQNRVVTVAELTNLLIEVQKQPKSSAVSYLLS